MFLIDNSGFANILVIKRPVGQGQPPPVQINLQPSKKRQCITSFNLFILPLCRPPPPPGGANQSTAKSKGLQIRGLSK